jgi:hypothetical protein
MWIGAWEGALAMECSLTFAEGCCERIGLVVPRNPMVRRKPRRRRLLMGVGNIGEWLLEMGRIIGASTRIGKVNIWPRGR